MDLLFSLHREHSRFSAQIPFPFFAGGAVFFCGMQVYLVVVTVLFSAVRREKYFWRRGAGECFRLGSVILRCAGAFGGSFGVIIVAFVAKTRCFRSPPVKIPQIFSFC